MFFTFFHNRNIVFEYRINVSYGIDHVKLAILKLVNQELLQKKDPPLAFYLLYPHCRNFKEISPVSKTLGNNSVIIFLI